MQARRWVLVPGDGPRLPAQALVRLEGRVAVQYRQVQLLALARAAAGRAKSDAGLTETAVDPGAPGLPAPITSSTTSTSTTTTTTPLSATVVTPAPAAPGVAGLSSQGRPCLGLAAYGPHILGNSLLSVAQIEGWFESTGARGEDHRASSELVADYVEAGRLTGVRADSAFAQSVVETGYFSFPPGGQLVPKNNNFAGIGACDKCKHGWSFPSAMAGVVGQEGLLVSTPVGPWCPVPLVPAGSMPAVRHGCRWPAYGPPTRLTVTKSSRSTRRCWTGHWPRRSSKRGSCPWPPPLRPRAEAGQSGSGASLSRLERCGPGPSRSRRT